MSNASTEFKYHILHECDDEQARAIGALVRQLGPRYPRPITQTIVADVLALRGNTLFVAMDMHGEIRGILLLMTLFAVTGNKVWIEDFVVDKACRGQGLGRGLLDHAVGFARREGVTHINLTARNARTSATKLYESAGFLRHDTNYYRLTLRDADSLAA